jgi:hypothetical protein
MYLCTHKHTCIYKYIYIYTYTRVHIHTQTHVGLAAASTLGETAGEIQAAETGLVDGQTGGQGGPEYDDDEDIDSEQAAMLKEYWQRSFRYVYMYVCL